MALVVVFAAGALGLLPGRAGDAALHDYLMAHPEILVDMQTKLQAEQDAATQETQQDAVDKLGTKAFFVADLPTSPAPPMRKGPWSSSSTTTAPIVGLPFPL